MRAEVKPFWMVAGDGPCILRHGSREAAEAEAKRLARHHPEHWFVVVESISAHRKMDVESVTLRTSSANVSDDGIPF